jgi:hypothetical protein
MCCHVYNISIDKYTSVGNVGRPLATSSQNTRPFCYLEWLLASRTWAEGVIRSRQSPRTRKSMDSALSLPCPMVFLFCPWMPMSHWRHVTDCSPFDLTQTIPSFWLPKPHFLEYLFHIKADKETGHTWVVDAMWCFFLNRRPVSEGQWR